MTLDRSGDRPAYRQLADLIRDQILTGDLEAGAEVPSRPQLAAEHGLALATVGEALQLLAQQGLIVREPGRPYRVRPTRVHTTARYEAGKVNYSPDQESRFAAEHGVPWSAFELARVYETVPAAKLVAAALKIEQGAPVVRRRWTHATGGVVLRVSWSYLDAERFGATILCDLDEPPWPGGTIAQLTALGYDVRTVPTSVGTRQGTDLECTLLGIEPGSQVLEEWRVQMCAVHGPVEVAHRVYPDSARLWFEVQVNSSSAADFWRGISYD